VSKDEFLVVERSQFGDGLRPTADEAGHASGSARARHPLAQVGLVLSSAARPARSAMCQ